MTSVALSNPDNSAECRLFRVPYVSFPLLTDPVTAHRKRRISDW